MKLLLFISLFIISFYLNCSNIAGGTSTETTNGAVIISSSGTLVPKAEVLVIDNSIWYEQIVNGKSPVIDTLYSDSNGFVLWEESNTSRTFQISYNDEIIINRNLTDTIKLKKGISVSGKLQNYNKVHLGGTAFSVNIGDNDSFFIDNVPTGTYSLFGETENALSFASRMKLKIDSTLEIENYSDTSLLFDDFMDGFDNNPLSQVTYGFYWYTFSDYMKASYSDGVWVTQDSKGSGSTVVEPSVLDGSVRFDVTLGSGINGAYGGMGARLFGSSYEDSYDLSDMSSITFRLHGTGTVAFFLKSGLIDSVNNTNSLYDISDYHLLIDLPAISTDTTFQIDAFHMDIEDSQYESIYPFSKCLENIKVLQINYRTLENAGENKYWFELDEIKFNNVSLPL